MKSGKLSPSSESISYFHQIFFSQFRCASWSPKGKQIVVAFPNGKLAQYKPDLKLAKAIPNAVPLFPGPYDPIAIQWLSTYQFAVVFLEKKQDAGPSKKSKFQSLREVGYSNFDSNSQCCTS